MAIRKDEDLARDARIRVERWRGHWKYNIDQYHELTNFVLGRQWTDDEEDMLKTFKKVPLQFNKLATLINTLLGEQQQNTPMLEVNPLSSCSAETAEIRKLLVQDICLSADAKTIYQVAASQSFIGGFGVYVVDTDYEHERSFDQKIVFRKLNDPTRAYFDISAEEIDKTDGMYSGYISRMSRRQFRELYGKDVEEQIFVDSGITQSKEEIALAVQPNTVEDPFNWNDATAISIINDFKRTYVKDTLYRLSNGREIYQDEMNELIESSKEYRKMLDEQQEQMQQQADIEELMGHEGQPAMPMKQPGMMPGMPEMDGMQQAMEQPGMMGEPEPVQPDMPQMPMPQNPEEMAFEAGEIEEEEREMLWDDGEPVRIVNSKKMKRSKIMRYCIAGDFVIEETEFPADDLGVIFVDQNSFTDKYGKQICRAFIVDAIDAQRYLNYLATQSAFILKISRYDQFIGSKKNVASLDTQRNWRDPNSVQGMITYDESPSGAKPEQLRPPELSQSLTQQYTRAMEDLYTSTGLYPTRLGQQGNEISGAAIDARTRQGNFTTYVAFNSINRAITSGGKIVNQMIPRIYDTERVISLMTPDKGRQNITINQEMDEYGVKVKNDVRKGEFEVKLQAGPSYEGQKAQALESLNMILKANPQLLNLVADLYAESLPLSNNLEIKNRLKTIVPPEIIQAGKTGEVPQQQNQGPDPEEQRTMAEIEYKKAQIEIKKQELQMKMQEFEKKSQLDEMKMELDRLDVAAKLEEQKLRYMAEMDRTHSDNAISHADNITKLITHGYSKKTGAQNVEKQY